MKTISRSAGRSVVAAAAYRLGERLHDEVHDITHDYTRKQGIVASFTVAPVGAPSWAHEPEKLWNAAERAEKRINSTVGREIELALPSLLTPEERQQITERFAGELVDRYGVAVSVALHEPGRGGDNRNFHAHVLFTTREMTPDGLGKKTRILDDRKTGREEVVKLRKLAADLINDALKAVNSDIRVDHRSFADRGIEREATIHLGPKASGQERRGEPTRAGDYNRHVEDYNRILAERAAVEKEIAAEQEQPQDQASAAGRVASDVKSFAKAVRGRGAVADVQRRDRLPWWQRTSLSLWAERTRKVARELAQKTGRLWQQMARYPKADRGPEERGRDR